MTQAWLAPILSLALLAANAPTAELDLSIERVRSDKGVLQLCVTRDPSHFPDCGGDPAALKRTVPAGAREVRLGGLQPGRYAVAVFHDENNNRRLDTMLGVPREGFAFSRNPRVRFGAPRFSQVEIELDAGISRYPLRMQYIL